MRRQLWAAIAVRRRTGPWRFWGAVVLATVVGMALGGAVVWLLATDHQGVVAAALFVALHLGPMLLVLAVGSLILLGIRAEGWRPVTQKGLVTALLVAVLPVFVATVFLKGLLEAVPFQRQLARMPALAAVEVGCQTVRDPLALAELQQAFRQSQWFMPVSHGWTGAYSLRIRTQLGEQRTYWLTEVAYEGNLVLNPTRTSATLAVSAALARTLTRLGAVRITERASPTGRHYWVVALQPSCSSGAPPE